MDAAVRFPTSPKALKAAPVKLSKRMNVEQAFQAIARNCLDQVRANEAGVARVHDAESLHQMRVGLRRLHAAFGLFGDLLAAPPVIEAELIWLRDRLAPARDWDVLVDATLPRIAAGMPGTPELEALRGAVQIKCAATYADASGAVASPRFGKLVNMLEQWIEQRGWRDEITAKARTRLKMRVTAFASTILEQEQQRLLKRGRKLRQSDPAARHRVRIAAKRARYATEFFASLYPGKRVRPHVQALTAVQDELGWLNDAAVAGRLLDELDDDSQGARAGAAMARGYLASCMEEGAPMVRKRLKKFAAMPGPA
jgi:triphosphatase